MEAFSVKNLKLTYPLSKTPAVDDVSFSVNRGELVVLCGETGSGKTTLMRLLKNELAPHGEKSGEISFMGKKLSELTAQDSASKIGFVMQNPQTQIVTDRVYSELAFGLENLGVPTPAIRRRISEMSSYFGVGEWFNKKTDELSGGQQQLLNLAAVTAMQPEVILLDEPTSQLDPVAAAEFISTLKRLNSELGMTIIISEHRLEQLLPIADKVLVMKKGRLVANGSPREVCTSVKALLDEALPAPVRLGNYFSVKEEDCPLTVGEGRSFIENRLCVFCEGLPIASEKRSGKPVLRFHDVWFRYERHSPDVLCGASFEVMENEIFCILGDNASGKTTALRVAAGQLKPHSGKVLVKGKRTEVGACALLGQSVKDAFSFETVREELDGFTTELFDFSPLMDRHPYDLSGGEQQLLGLAKLLKTGKDILLLDEPTKGVDAAGKLKLSKMLRALRDMGKTVVIVTHDVEFAALCADTCAMFFNGAVTSTDEPHAFFSQNCFYTTAANRMARGICDNIITTDELCSSLRLKDGIN